MKIELKRSYNIVYDDLKDSGSGSLAHLLSKQLLQDNLSAGLEHGVPFISELGVVVSQSMSPTNQVIVLSHNKPNVGAENIDISAEAPYVIQYLLRSYGVKADLRMVKAICKPYKKTETYKKYLNCLYSLACELEDEEAKTRTIESTSYGVPFYKKVIMTAKLLSNLTRSNLNQLLFYRRVWGEENLLSVFLYLTSERGLPDYIQSELGGILLSPVYQKNLINFGVSLGQGELNRFLVKGMIEVEG